MDIACVSCVDGLASFCCKTCNVHFCKICEEIHFKGISITSSLHEVVALFEEDDLMLKSRSPFCPHHPEVAVNCFCEINQEPICAICAFEYEHTRAHECRKMTLQDEEARQREILAPGLFYVQKVQTTLEDLEESFKTQLIEDKALISSYQKKLKQGKGNTDKEEEFLSTHLTCLEKNVALDIETLEVLMWTTSRFVDDFNSIKDLYGYGFITATKNLHLTTLLEEIRSQESQLPPVRKLNTSTTWPHELKLKLKDLGLRMTIKSTRDYSQINKRPILQFGSCGYGDGKFDYSYCIAISPNGDIFVTDTFKHSIQVFDQNGNFLFKFGAKRNGIEQFNGPRGIAFDPKRNRVFVSDGGNNRIQYFDLKGRFLGSFGLLGIQDGQIDYPVGIGNDDDTGDIYVVDCYNHRVQVFDANLKFIRKFGKIGNGNGELNEPWGIGILSDGQIVVSERGGNRLSVFEKDGKFVKHIASGQLLSPHHLFVDGKDNILVADRNNNRIAIFSFEGKLIKSIGNVSDPRGITMDEEGKLFASCEHKRQIWVF